MKSVLKALMAASMLMPIAAQAQEVGDRGPGGPGGPGRRGDWNAPGGPRPDRGRPPVSAEVGVDAQIRAERPQWRGERPGGPEGAPWRGDRPERQSGQDARPGGDHRPDWRGADRPDQRAEQRPDPRFERRPDWQRPDRPDRPPVIGNDDRRGWDQRRDDDRRRDWDRQQRERRDWDRAQTDRRWIDDRVRAQGGAWDRGWNDRGRYDRRNGWDRQWRNDGRYDWSRYRALNRGAYRLPRYYAPSGWGYGYRRFGIGVSLAPILFSQSYWIDDPFAYRLPEAYGPYRWVRYYDDALLVDIRTGQVVDTVYDIFF